MTDVRPSAAAHAWPPLVPPTPAHRTDRHVAVDSRAGDLADAARRFRGAVQHPQSGADLPLAFSHLEGVLDDLSAGAELAAHAVIEHGRPSGAPVTCPARPGARAISWRLHALRDQLVIARNTCAEVRRASEGAERD